MFSESDEDDEDDDEDDDDDDDDLTQKPDGNLFILKKCPF